MVYNYAADTGFEVRVTALLAATDTPLFPKRFRLRCSLSRRFGQYRVYKVSGETGHHLSRAERAISRHGNDQKRVRTFSATHDVVLL